MLAQGVFTDDKIISFRGKGLVVDLIVTLPEDKPQLFKNVTTNVVKLSDGTLCYTVSSIAGSKTYNRRQSYRCYVGIETAVQCGLNRAAHDAIIKDISYNGFSVVSKEDLKLEVNQTVHAVLNDHMDETAENFNFHLYGLVARIHRFGHTFAVGVLQCRFRCRRQLEEIELILQRFRCHLYGGTHTRGGMGSRDGCPLAKADSAILVSGR